MGEEARTSWTFECSSQREAVAVAARPSRSEWSNIDRSSRETTVLALHRKRRHLVQVRSGGATPTLYIPKGLILVTGVVKCNSWSIATILKSSRAHTGNVSLSLSPIASGSVSASPSHSWREYLHTMCHSGPEPPSENENQCLFIRGYRIMKQSIVPRLVNRVKAIDLRGGKTGYYKLPKIEHPPSKKSILQPFSGRLRQYTQTQICHNRGLQHF